MLEILNYNNKIGKFCNRRWKITSSSCFDKEFQVRKKNTYLSFFQHLVSVRLNPYPVCHFHTFNTCSQLLDMLLMGRLNWIPVFRIISFLSVSELSHESGPWTFSFWKVSLSFPILFLHTRVSCIVVLLYAPFEVYFQKIFQEALFTSTLSMPFASQPALYLSLH